MSREVLLKGLCYNWHSDSTLAQDFGGPGFRHNKDAGLGVFPLHCCWIQRWFQSLEDHVAEVQMAHQEGVPLHLPSKSDRPQEASKVSRFSKTTMMDKHRLSWFLWKTSNSKSGTSGFEVWGVIIWGSNFHLISASLGKDLTVFRHLWPAGKWNWRSLQDPDTSLFGF